MSDDYEEYDRDCQKCGHYPLHIADCIRIGCDDGYCDEFYDDQINSPAEGENYYLCEECNGTGSIVWCPICGADLTGHKFPDENDYEQLLF